MILQEQAHGLEKLHPVPCLLAVETRLVIALHPPVLILVSRELKSFLVNLVPTLILPVTVPVILILQLASLPAPELRQSNGVQAFLAVNMTPLVRPIRLNVSESEVEVELYVVIEISMVILDSKVAVP